MRKLLTWHCFTTIGSRTLFVFACIFTVIAVKTDIAFSQTESHPSIIYTPEDTTVIKERLIREPYLTWFNKLITESDKILDSDVSWSGSTVPKATQAYYSKLLAGAYAFSDSLPNRVQYAEEAALSLYYMPQSSYDNSFSSDLDVSESAMYWAEAYDMLKGAGYSFNIEGKTEVESTIRQKLQKLRDYMGRDLSEDLFTSPGIARDYLSAAYSAGHEDNHHVKLYGSLVVLSLTIYDMSGSDADFSRAKERLLASLENMTITGDNGEKAGGWAEGPLYHRYSALQYMPAIHAMKNKGILDYSSLPELVRTHLLLPEMVMPDGKTPPFDDNEAVIFDTVGLLYSEHKDSPDRDMLLWMWDLNDRVFGNNYLPDYIAQFDETPRIYANPDAMGWNPTAFYPESGFARFRNSWDSNSLNLLFLCEHGEARINGQAHEHPDPNSFILNGFGEMLMLDSGYGGWEEHDVTRFAVNHNIVLVNGEGPEGASQEFPSNFWDANGADSFLRESFTSPRMDYATGETSYFNTTFDRHIIFPGHEYFLLYDALTSQNQNSYTLLLHGNGGGTSGGSFSLAGNGAEWTKGNAHVRSCTVGTSTPSFTTADMNHAVYSREPMLTHTVLKASLSGDDESFLTLLFPYEQDDNPPDISTFEEESVSGILIAGNGYTDRGCIARDDSMITYTTAEGNCRSDGSFVYTRTTGGEEPARVFVLDGSFFTVDDDTLFSSSKPIAISISHESPTIIEGYIQAAEETSLTFYSLMPLSVSFNGVEVEYSNINNNLQFTIPAGQGPFSIEYTTAPIILTPSLPDALQDSLYSFQVEAMVVNDSDSLTYTLAEGPSWLSLSSSGMLSGTPGNVDAAESEPVAIIVSASGGADTLMTAIFIKNILDPPGNVTAIDQHNERGRAFDVSWVLSPDDGKGLVNWYRIYRSRSSELSEILPLDSFPTADSLASWESHNTVLVDSVSAGMTQYTDSLFIENDVSYFYWIDATGGGESSVKVASAIVMTVETTSAKAPTSFRLDAPYPNPFNPSTTIGYALPGESQVSIVVYNISGQSVATLFQGKQKGGLYTVMWDAASLPSGLYFITLRAGSFTGVRKVLFIK